MRRVRVKEGSIADYCRVIALGCGFWGLIFWAILTSYPY